MQRSSEKKKEQGKRKKPRYAITYIGIIILYFFLNLLVLDIVASLNVQDTVDVDASLELANHEVVLAVGLDTLNGETSDPRVSLARQVLGLGVAGLQVKRLFSVEGEDLGRGQDTALVEDGQAGVLVRNIRSLLPAKLDGVADNVLDSKVTDAEGGGENGAAEGGSTSESLVSVQGEGERLAEEVLDALLEGRNTRATANNLDNIDVILGKLGLGKSLLEDAVGAAEEGLDHGLELLAGDHGRGIDVVHERLDVDGSLLVGRQDLLGLLSGSNGSSHGTAVGEDVDLVLALELLGKVLNESLIEVSATKVAVPGSGLDSQLTLLELDDGACVAAVADVDKGNTSRLLLGAREIELGDTPAKSSGGAIVDESEKLETSDLGGVDEGSALDVSEPRGHGHADVGNGELELGGGCRLDLAQVHADQLSGRELLLVAQVVDLGANLAVDIAESRCDILLLNLNIGIVEGSAGETLEAVDGVLEVGDLLGLGRLTKISGLGAEAYQRTLRQQC